jgi:hypothetical protein
MRTRWLAPLCAAAAAVGLMTAEAQAALLTIEQAIELSQKTGRPILAVAGSKT